VPAVWFAGFWSTVKSVSVQLPTAPKLPPAAHRNISFVEFKPLGRFIVVAYFPAPCNHSPSGTSILPTAGAPEPRIQVPTGITTCPRWPAAVTAACKAAPSSVEPSHFMDDAKMYLPPPLSVTLPVALTAPVTVHALAKSQVAETY